MEERVCWVCEGGRRRRRSRAASKGSAIFSFEVGGGWCFNGREGWVDVRWGVGVGLWRASASMGRILPDTSRSILHYLPEHCTLDLTARDGTRQHESEAIAMGECPRRVTGVIFVHSSSLENHALGRQTAWPTLLLLLLLRLRGSSSRSRGSRLISIRSGRLRILSLLLLRRLLLLFGSII